MGWEARTNTGRVMPGAVFEVIETQQSDNHVPGQPPTNSPITVFLSGSAAPITGRVVLSTDRDLVLHTLTMTNWRLRRWASGDGLKIQNYPGLQGQHWTVAMEVEGD